MSEVLEGLGKRLEVHPDRVVIKRTDTLASVIPEAFGDAQQAHFDQIESVSLHAVEQLKLKECEAGCLQLVVRCHDHTTLSLTLKRDNYKAAQAMRAFIESKIND